MRTVPKQALDMIRHWEGCELQAYQDVTGLWTIGYGFTSIFGVPVKPGQTMTQQEADRLLGIQVTAFMHAILPFIRVPVNDNQLSALISFAYNEGVGAFQKSTLLKDLNAGEYRNAAHEFLRWDYAAGREVPGLERRREAEKELFERAV